MRAFTIVAGLVALLSAAVAFSTTRRSNRAVVAVVVGLIALVVTAAVFYALILFNLDESL